MPTTTTPKSTAPSLLDRLRGIRQERQDVAESDADAARVRLQDFAIRAAAGEVDPDAAEEIDRLLAKLDADPGAFERKVGEIRELVRAGAAARRAERFRDGYSEAFADAVTALRAANDARNAANRRVHELKRERSAAMRRDTEWSRLRSASPEWASDPRITSMIDAAAADD